MFILMGDYYRNKLSLIEIKDKKVIDEKTILDLTEFKGPRIIQAGFLSSEKFYVVFETDWRDYTEILNKIRIYDLSTLNWEDVFDYYNTANIRIVDVETSGAYFSVHTYGIRNILYFLDINNQTSNEILNFSIDEEIIYINCRFNDSLIAVNTLDKNGNYKYYFIEKQSHEKITEGTGQLFASKDNNYVMYNNLKVYIIDDIVNPTFNTEVPLENNKIFSSVTGIYKNTFVLTLYSTTPMLWANFLFGGSYEREHYDYWIVTVNNNVSDIEYLRIFRNNINFSNKIFFDAFILENNEYSNFDIH
jgi:hypothetical protein